MHLLMIALNGGSLVVIMVCSMTLYLQRAAPKGCDWKHCFQKHIIQISLVMISIGSFGALLSPAYGTEFPDWWNIVSRCGIAVLAYKALKASFHRRRIDDNSQEPAHRVTPPVA